MSDERKMSEECKMSEERKMSEEHLDLNKYVGHRVCLSFNKKGIFRYWGYVSFAPGKWCGIELDEAEGNTDGRMTNVNYFSCKKNHGIFVKASEISNLILTENDFEFVTLHPDDQNTDKKPDDTSDDSDESLGLLPLHLLDKISDDEFILDKNETCTKEEYELHDEFILDKNETCTKEEYELHNNETNAKENVIPFVKNLSEQDMFSAWNTTNADEISPIQSKTPRKSETITHEDLEKLNVTLSIHDRISEIDEVKVIEKGSILTDVEEFFSPVYKVSKILKIPPIEPHDESLSKIVPTQFASTPKSDANCTFVLDEKILNSGANFSPVSHLNKTIVKRQDSMQTNVLSNTITFSDINENSNSEKNKKNTTCNTKLLENSQHELNITFNAITDVKCLPVVKSYDSALLNTTITFPEEYENKDQTSKIKISGSNKEENILSQYDKMIETNGLNKTISLPEKLDNINLDKTTDSNTKVSDFFAEEKFEYNIITNISNCAVDTTTPIDKELKNKAKMLDLEKEYVHDRTETLNTTYKRMDTLSRLPKIFKSQKQPMIKDTGHAESSKIARRIDSVPSLTSAYSNVFPELDKKRNRKSISIPSNSNSGMLNKNNRRQTFGSSLSKTSDNVASPQSPLLQNVQKQHFPSRATSAPRSLSKPSPSHDYVHRRYSDKEKTSIESAECKKLTYSTAEVSHSLVFPVNKIKNVTSATEKQFEQDPKLLQDKTVTPIQMSDAKSTVLKAQLTKTCFVQGEQKNYRSMLSSTEKSSQSLHKKQAFCPVETQEKKMVKFPEKRVLLMKNKWNSPEISLRQNVEKTHDDESTKRPLRSRIPAPSAYKKKSTGAEKEKSKAEMQGAQKKTSKTSPPQRIMM